MRRRRRTCAELVYLFVLKDEGVRSLKTLFSLLCTGKLKASCGTLLVTLDPKRCKWQKNNAQTRPKKFMSSNLTIGGLYDIVFLVHNFHISLGSVDKVTNIFLMVSSLAI